jgi:hypothetical protein
MTASRTILIFGFVLIPFFVNHATPDDYEFSSDGIPAEGSLAANYAAHSAFGAAVGAMLSNNPALQSFLTPGIRALVRRRLTKSAALVTENSRMSDKEKLDAKIALLVVREVNPFQEFYPAEHALVKGVCLKTIREKNDQRNTKPL